MKVDNSYHVGTSCKLHFIVPDTDSILYSISKMSFSTYDEAVNAKRIILMFRPDLDIEIVWHAYLLNFKNEKIYISIGPYERAAKQLLFSIIPLNIISNVKK